MFREKEECTRRTLLGSAEWSEGISMVEPQISKFYKPICRRTTLNISTEHLTKTRFQEELCRAEFASRLKLREILL
jgi:hypothetical protein